MYLDEEPLRPVLLDIKKIVFSKCYCRGSCFEYICVNTPLDSTIDGLLTLPVSSMRDGHSSIVTAGYSLLEMTNYQYSYVSTVCWVCCPRELSSTWRLDSSLWAFSNSSLVFGQELILLRWVIISVRHYRGIVLIRCPRSSLTSSPRTRHSSLPPPRARFEHIDIASMPSKSSHL